MSMALAGLRSRACRRTSRFHAKALVLASAATVLALAAGAAFAAAPVPPKLLPPRDLSSAGVDAVIPDVASDAKGNTVVVWAQAKGSDWTVQAVYRPAGGTWGSPRVLSMPASHVASPQVAIAGTTVSAVWERFDGRNLITQTADLDRRTGTWGIPTSLSLAGRDAQAPRIAVNARGDAVAVWASVGLSGWSVQSSYRPAGGSWQPATPLDSPQAGTAAPDVVIDTTGVATAVWTGTMGIGWRVSAATRQTDGTWTKEVTLSETDPSGSLAPLLALEGTGDATAVWSRAVGASTLLELSTRSAVTGAWSPAKVLFPSVLSAIAPQIATDRRGDGVIVWTSSGKSGLSVMVSVRRPRKPWGVPVSLVTSGSGPVAPQVALDAQGAALVVWAHSAGGPSRAQAAGLAAGGVLWSKPRTLSKAGFDALTPEVALDPDGDGAVAWAHYDGRSFVIQAAGYDGAGPVLDKLSVPVSGVAGTRLMFSVAPRDVWSAVSSIHWSFGDGTVGGGKLTSHIYKQPGRYEAKVTASDLAGRMRTLRRMITISAG
jgi:PKD domain